ncbi:hypothetical protein ACWM35_13715 [Neobacillus sp. K501]
MEWYVRLKGKDFELQCLSEIFNTEEVSIEWEKDKEQPQYILKSNQFLEYKKPIEVLNKGKEIIQMVNGIGNLTLDFFNNVHVDAVVGTDEQGKHYSVFFDEVVMIGRGIMTAKGEIIRNGAVVKDDEESISIHSNWIKLSLKDENVKTVIRQLSYGIDSWVNLYRILEVVEGDLGKKHNVASKGWTTKKQRDLFKHTANNPHALGDHARHGWTNDDPPKNPMELNEAKNMIRNVLIGWFNLKT